MAFTNYPNGVTSFGIPVIGGYPYHAPNNLGKVLFVDATLGSDGNDGSFDRPFATIVKALSFTANNRGDLVLVYPGSYNEVVAITSKNYLQLLGIQQAGYAKPDIVPTTGKGINSTLTQGLVLKHLRVVSADDDTVYHEGNGFLFEDCVFDGDTNGATNANLRLRGNASDDSYTGSEGRIINVLFRDSQGFGLVFDTGSAPGNGVGCSDVEVFGCRFYGNGDADIATRDSGGGVYSVQRTLIAHNYFITKNKATYIDFTTANGGADADQNGLICDNYFASTAFVAGTDIKIVGTGFTFAGNYNEVGVVDGSGLD